MSDPLPALHVRRLTTADHDLARRAFALLAEVFETPGTVLGDAYLDRLLGRPDFWAGVATVGDEVVGAVTAHALPLTLREASELCIYDVAVHPDHQRHGVGRALVTAVRRWAAASGVVDTFVLADDEDEHALDFYRALGGESSPVTAFTFGPPDAPAA